MKRSLLWLFLSLIPVLATSQSAESDLLFAQGVDHYRAGRYREAAALFAQVQALDNATFPGQNVRKDYGAHWAAACWHHLGNDKRAREVEQSLYAVEPVDRRLTVHGDSLINLCLTGLETGDHAAALSAGEAARAELEATLGAEHPYLAYSGLFQLLFFAQGYNGQFAQAEATLQRSEELTRRTFRPDNPAYYTPARDRADYLLYNRGNAKEAGEVARDALQQMRSQKLTESEVYLHLLETRTMALFQTGQQRAYSDTARELLKLAAKPFGKNSDSYLRLYDLVAHQMEQLNCPEALDHRVAFTELVREAKGERSYDYAMNAVLTATTAIRQKRFKLARTYGERGRELLQQHFPDSMETIVTVRFILAEMDFADGHQERGAATLAQLMPDMEKHIGREHPFYQLGQTLLATFQGKKDITASDARQLLKTSNDLRNQYATATLTPEQKFRNWTSDLTTAASLCLAGDHRAGRQMGLAATDSLRQLLEDPAMGWAVHSGQRQLATASQLLKRELFRSRSDSVSYALALLLRETLHLRMDGMARLDSLNSYYFHWALQEYQRTLHYTGDTVQTRAVVQHFADLCQVRFGQESLEYLQCLGSLAGCYATTAPEYLPLQELRLALSQAINARRGWELAETRSILEAVYQARGDTAALASMRQQEQQEKKKSRNHYDWWSEAHAEQQLGNYARALELYEKAFELQLQSREKPIRGLRGSSIYFNAGTTAGNIVDMYLHLGRRDEVPALGAMLIAQMKAKRPETWQEEVTGFMNSAVFYRDNTLWQDILAHAAQQLPYVQQEHALQAVALTKPYWDGIVGSDAYDEAIRRMDQALDLTKDSAPRLHDELQLIRLTIRYYHAFHSPGSFAPEPLRAFADEALQLLRRFPEHDRSQEYAQALTMRVQALKALCREDATQQGELSRACRELAPLLQQERRSLLREGELQKYGGWIGDFHITDEEMNREACQAAQLLQDLPLMASTGSYAVRRQLRQVQDYITSVGHEYLQDQLSQMVADATRLALLTRQDSLAALAYDAAIFSKGALLRSEKLMQRQILDSRNQTAIERYRELERTRLLLDGAGRSGLPADSLKRRVSVLNEQVMADARHFGDYAKALSASWQDIRRQLKDREAAIEFTTTELGDTTLYCALVLRHDAAAPDLLRLCSEGELAALQPPYASPELVRLIWAPIAWALQGAETVYFSPAGRLHQMPIEYATTASGTIADRYHLCRLSNTRELLHHREAEGQQKAVLIGGVEYQLDAQTWADATRANHQPLQELLAMRDVVDFDAEALRGADMYLEGTEVEVREIARSYEDAGAAVACLTGAEATEDAFKNLSGTDLTALHIATHGFYLTPEAARRQQPSAEGNGEDEAMSRSGLLMAGAQTYLHEHTAPEGAGDGILTARELSRMDLTTADLVVLSACETGLGDIRGDGVFGLQRGFKKAGAGTLVMSLWKVSDSATQLLMTEFYRALLNLHLTKRQALQHAQQFLRTTDNGRYADPQFWAAFVMLDAVE